MIVYETKLSHTASLRVEHTPGGKDWEVVVHDYTLDEFDPCVDTFCQNQVEAFQEAEHIQRDWSQFRKELIQIQGAILLPTFDEMEDL